MSNLQILFKSIVVFVLCDSVYSQNGFNHTYDNGRLFSFRTVTWGSDSTLLLSGIYRDESLNLQQLAIISMDTLGQVLRIEIIADSNGSSHLSMNIDVKACQTNEHLMVFPYQYVPRNSIGVCFVGESLDDIQIREYHIDTIPYIFPKKIVPFADGWLIIGASQTGPVPSNGILLKLKNDQSVEWVKIYDDADEWEAFYDIIKENENKYHIGGWSTSYKESLGVILSIDTTGTIAHEYRYSGGGFDHGAIFGLDYNSSKAQINYLSEIVRQTSYPGENYEVSAPLLVSLDADYNVVSIDSLEPFTNLRRLITLKSSLLNGLLLSGSTSGHTDDSQTPYFYHAGEVLRYDSSGFIRWNAIDTAFFSPIIGSRSYFTDLVEASSGSIYAAGYAKNLNQDDEFREYAWLVKLTPDGCIDTLCSITGLPELTNSEPHHIKVVPNPVVDGFVFSNLPDDPQGYTLHLYNGNGVMIQSLKVMEATDIIHLPSWPPGIYYWRLQSYSSTHTFSGTISIMR